MAKGDIVPLLGFEDEWHEDQDEGVLYIRVPLHHPNRSQAILGIDTIISVYRWSSREEGYNVFIPGMDAVSCKSAFEAKMIIQDFMNEGLNV